jgi:BirA family biotin operon repressor/biotin-[acetyl-CoA-carboxylase] ligase
MHLPDPTFPPLLSGHDAPGAESAFASACSGAASGQFGAGDVVWSRHVSRVDMAIVLEPEVPLETAVQMMPLSMVAIGDCLGALTPPQVGVTFSWPGEIRVNGAFAGNIRAAAAGSGNSSVVPRWMVIGLWLRHRREDSEPEPGEVPEQTWLSEEGCGELTRTDVIESFSRHFLTWLNDWNEDGFRAVHGSWIFRAHDKDEEISLAVRGNTLKGTFNGLDDNGNLLLASGGKTKAAMLIDVFEYPES